ncbi:TetR/AcrR family transcriptional regulator [Rugamonas sp.]|uniref:TetR/AcrR family transcriptional regulator n=1 Tax=Rugamonas sp. TaxID=1926287 RepID=UPI0025ECBBCF|nr:TetR/AcrR family transcriptional regulator [Rugamonas sp.]
MKISTTAEDSAAPQPATMADGAANDADVSDDASADLGAGPDLPGYGKSAGRPRAADKEARLQNLLHTASCLFLEKGYGKVSLEMIAREAHVAVRTIYVKFGGKAGLLNAVIAAGRARYFGGMFNMETDTRSIEEILTDFSLRFVELVSLPAFCNLHRMVIAEAGTTPELAQTFYQAGPKQTREQLAGFFSRADIQAQIRSELPPELLAIHLLNCLLGDQTTRLLFEPEVPRSEAENLAHVQQAIGLFLHGVLRAH